MATIAVTIRNVFGRDMFYPANTSAEVLAHIAGTRTLSVSNLKDARALGLTIKCATDPRITDLIERLTA